MKGKNTTILFVLSILFFSLSLIGVYVYGQTTTVYHPAGEITAGNFQTGTYSFQNTSKVGIGTTSPTDDLSIKKSSITSSGISISAGRTDDYRYKIASVDSNNYLGIGYWTSDWFPTAGTPALVLKYTGNVGIGTTSPATDWKVDVNGALLGRGEIRSTSGVVRSMNPSNGTANVFLGWLNNTAQIRYGGTGEGSLNGLEVNGTGDATKFKIYNNGDIRVYGKLRVNGGELIVRNSDDSDNGNVQAKIIYSSTFMNGTAIPNISGVSAGAGDIAIIADSSTGDDVFVRGNSGGDSARLHVYRIYATQICLGGVCKTAW